MKSRQIAGILSVLLLVIVVLTIAWGFTNIYSDDAQISLRYAQRLLNGDGLTWSDGEWVEGYSNFLWVVLVAGLGALGFDLMVATQILGVTGLVAGVVLISLGDDGRPDWRRALSGGAFLALSGGMGVWAVLGLSHTFLAAIALGALLAIRKAEQRWGLVAGAILLTIAMLLRADGMVLVAGILIGSLARGLRWRRVVLLSIAPALAWLAQEGFRLWYYQDWVPNTARVKVSFTLERAMLGVGWIGDALFDHGPLVLGALVSVVVLRRKALDAFVVAVLWCAYVAYVGGDIFRGWRMFMPAVPMFAVLVSDASERFGKMAWGGMAVAATIHGGWNLTQEDSYRTFEGPDWTLTAEAVAKVMVEGFGDADPLLAVDAAGALPYFTQFRAVDMLGLCDRYLPRHPPPHWGKGGLGHDLGDGAYILGRKPDIVAFRSGLGGPATFLSGRQMVRTPTWPKHYKRAFIRGYFQKKPATGHFFIRTIDGPLAPVRTKEMVRFPGHLLGTFEQPAELLNGKLGPVIPAKQEMLLEFGLADGAWSVEVLGTGDVRAPEQVKAVRGRVKFKVRARGEQGHVTGLLLTRLHNHAQLNERVGGQQLGQTWNRARTTEKQRMQALEALGYVSGTEAPAATTGVLLHEAGAFDGYNLYVSGHAPEAFLMDMDGTIVHTWRKTLPDAFPDVPPEGRPKTGFWRRAHLLPDGSLLAIYDGFGMVKVDRDSKVIWSWSNPAHHDIEVLEDGRIWVLSRKAQRIDRINTKEPVLDDLVVLLSADGKVLKTISVLKAVEKSKASAKIFADREENFADVLHTNSLEVLDGRAKNPVFSAGRLLLSSRSISMIFVLDPDTQEVVWARTGTFAFQHDPKILDNGNLLLFDNSGPKNVQSAVREYDPNTMAEVWRFQGSSREPFFSRYCGVASRLPNGNTLMVESGVGRIIERTPKGEIVWEYASPHRTGPEDEYVAIIPDLVRIPRNEVSWLHKAPANAGAE